MELKKITLQLVTELLNDAHGKTRIGPGCDKKKNFERENQLLDFDDILKCRVHKDKPPQHICMFMLQYCLTSFFPFFQYRMHDLELFIPITTAGISKLTQKCENFVVWCQIVGTAPVERWLSISAN